MDKFLEMHNQPKLDQEVIENLNRPIMSKQMKSVIKKFSTQKTPRWDSFIREFYQTFNELTPILLNLFQNIKEEGIIQSSFYDASIALTPKPDKDTTKKKTIDQYSWGI